MRKYLWIFILAIAIVGIFINELLANAQESRQGRFVQFDFGLLDAPLRTGIQASNLKCRQLGRYDYICYDVLRPEILVPLNTQPQANEIIQ